MVNQRVDLETTMQLRALTLCTYVHAVYVVHK